MEPSAKGSCHICGAVTKLRCAKCTEGWDKYGNPSPTFYCRRLCQFVDYKNHLRNVCKISNDRRRLYRAAQLLKDIYDVYCEKTRGFEVQSRAKVVDIPKAAGDKGDQGHGSVVLKCAILPNITVVFPQLMERLFEGMKFGEEGILIATHAVDQLRCNPHFPKDALEGRTKHKSIALQLGNGSEIYFVDPAGALYCQHRPVLPLECYYAAYGVDDNDLDRGRLSDFASYWHQMRTGEPHSSPAAPPTYEMVGTMEGGYRMRLATLDHSGHRNYLAHLDMFSEAVNGAVASWERTNEKSIKQVLRGTNADFDKDRKDLVVACGASLEDASKEIESFKERNGAATSGKNGSAGQVTDKGGEQVPAPRVLTIFELPDGESRVSGLP